MPPAPSRLLPRLLILFMVMPIVELALLIWLGGQIGFLPTIGIIIATAVVGAWLAQREGLAVWRRFQTRLASGALPGRELTDGLIILVSGAFLLTPGVLTDVLGLLGLFPATRAGLRNLVSKRLKRSIDQGSMRMYSFGTPVDAHRGPGDRPADEEDIMDVPFEEFEKKEERRR
jgi:UPF0716 protein FxsA